MQKCLIITAATAVNLQSHFEDIQQTWTELKLYRILQMVTLRYLRLNWVFIFVLNHTVIKKRNEKPLRP